MSSANKAAAPLEKPLTFMEKVKLHLDREEAAVRFVQAAWRRVRRRRLVLEPRRRAKAPNGDVHFWRQGRRYRIERYNRSVEYYVPSKTHHADGKRLYAEWPDGRVDVFDGPDDNRHCVYAILSDGSRFHYEGDAGKEVRTRRDLPDGVVQFFATNEVDGEFVKEQWWPRSGLRCFYARASAPCYADASGPKARLEWFPSSRAEKIAALKREYRAAWAPYDIKETASPVFDTAMAARAAPPSVDYTPSPRNLAQSPTRTTPMENKKKKRHARTDTRIERYADSALLGLGVEGLRKVRAYHEEGKFDYDPFYDPPLNFTKILMGTAVRRCDRDMQSYCNFKNQQEKARAFCDAWGVDKGHFRFRFPDDRTLMMQEAAKRNLAKFDAGLIALWAQVRCKERPDDPGLRAIYERAYAIARERASLAKEICEAMNPRYEHMERIDHKNNLRQLRIDHLQATINHYKGRLRGKRFKDPGLRVIITWMHSKLRPILLNDPISESLGKDPKHWANAGLDIESSYKLFEVCVVDDGVAVVWGNYSDKATEAFWGWQWQGQLKTLEAEISDAIDIMKRAITSGLVKRWIIAPAKRSDAAPGERTELMQSELQLAHNGRWHAISEPLSAYWLKFFRCDTDAKCNVARDAWIGAEFLHTMLWTHYRCHLRDQNASFCKDAWLDVLAYEDLGVVEEAPPPPPAATAADAAPGLHEATGKANKKLAPSPPLKPTKKGREQEAARLARQLEEACAAEREQQLAAARAAEAEKKAVEDAKREEKRKQAEAERIQAEAIALEEAEEAEEAAKQAEQARVQQVRASRAAEHLEHREAQQKKRDPNATDLQRQLVEAAAQAAAEEREALRVAKLAKEQREAQVVQDEAYANDHEARMAAKAAEVAAKKAAAKAKKAAEKAAKRAQEEAEAVIAEQRRREEQAWAAAQAAPAAAPAPEPDSSNAAPADCIICMETKATHVIVPCGHFCLCARCARNQTQNQCPLCRAPAMHIIQGFF